MPVSSSASTSESHLHPSEDMFSTLPPETHLNIFSHLSPTDLVRLQQTTVYFNRLIRTHERELLKPFNGRWAHGHNHRLCVLNNAVNIRNLDILDALGRWSRYFDLYSRMRSSPFADAEYELGVFVKHYRAMNRIPGDSVSWPTDEAIKAFAWLLFTVQSTLERMSDSSSPKLRWRACEERLEGFREEHRGGTLMDVSTMTKLVTRVFEHQPLFGPGAYMNRWHNARWDVTEFTKLPCMPGNVREGLCVWRVRSGSQESAMLDLPRRYEALEYKIACPDIHELFLKEYEFVKEVAKAVRKPRELPIHGLHWREQLRDWRSVNPEALIMQEIVTRRDAYLDAYPAPVSLLMAAVLEQTVLWVPSQT